MVEIRELIEYSSTQKKALEHAERLGLDLQPFMDPTLDIDQLYYIQQLSIVNLPIVDDMDIGYIRSMKQLGYMFTNKKFAYDSNDLALAIILEKFKNEGYERSDEVKRQMWKYTEYSEVHYPLGLILTQYAFEKQPQLVKRIDRLKSTDEKLDQCTRNEMIGYLIIYGTPVEQIQQLLAEHSTGEIINLGYDIDREIRNLGQIRYLTDTRYSKEQRRTLLYLYLETGIDYRLLDISIEGVHEDYHANETTEMLDRYVELLDNYTKEEKQELRRLSNSWREERQNKSLTTNIKI